MGEESTGRMLFGDTGLLFAVRQWVSHTIYTNNSDNTFTFPIAFNDVYSAAARCDAHKATLRTSIMGPTKYVFTCDSPDGSGTCSAIFIGS